MGDSASVEVPLPLLVERLIGKICFDQAQPPPDTKARTILASIGEDSSIHMLRKISQTRIKTLSGFIKYLAKDYPPVTAAASESAESFFLSPLKSPSASISSIGTDDYIYHSPFPEHLIHSSAPGLKRASSPIATHFSPSSSLERATTPIATPFSPSSSLQRTNTPTEAHSLVSPSSNSERSNTPKAKRLIFSPSSSSMRGSSAAISQQWLILMELEFRKAFLVLSYMGRKKLEDVISIDDASNILRMKDYPMTIFEAQIWSNYGQYCLVGKESTGRRKYLDWDSGRTHHYYCQVYQDGSYSFTGPDLDTTKTLLHRTLGDENVLMVKFEEQPIGSTNFATCSNSYNAAYIKIADEGILIGHKRYRFFVFKDGDRKGKKKSPFSSGVKCYFVRMEFITPCDEREPYILANKTMHEARCLFMHLHTTSSTAKYVSRCSLILSKTIKLQVDFSSVHVETIEDIPCRDETGCKVCNEDGDPLIHTDGTGFISEDLAMKCPRGSYNAKYRKNENLEDKSSEGRVTYAHVRDPPLLMQCRLFHNGCAVKGTLLINRKLPRGTIQIRRSMVKVEADSSRNAPSLNSLEVVKISEKPRRATLSKYLIALLNFGGVPKQFFLDLLTITLEDAQSLYFNEHAAVRVSLNHGDIDDDSTTARMIFSGVPLNEPCVQYRLSRLASEERKGLQGGKLPISESFYLIGTADPTGLLNSNEVCVILDNGQISGKVLVYRSPGLHFGDIHVLDAVYLKDLEDVVGNAKYGIFFSTKGKRSVASEIANGDFDGDMYWVSRNPQLLHYFKVSIPWTRMHSSPKVFQRKPSEFIASDELERELFELFLNTKKLNISMGVAADSWLAFMDRLLTLGDDCANEKNELRKKMLNLIDIYYDALDAPKTGKKVVVPNHLKADMYPHHMDRRKEYHSTSVLGQINDAVLLSQTEKSSVEEIWKLPCFEHVHIADALLKLWKERYDAYRQEMVDALSSKDESKNSLADDVINKYKQMMYDAADFEGSSRNAEDIYKDALALYHVCYDYAKLKRDVSKCNFVWKVAGSALCKFHGSKATDKSMFMCLPSVLGRLLNL